MDFFVLFLASVCFLAIIFWYKYIYIPNQYFKKLGIPQPFVFPFVGNAHELLLLGSMECQKRSLKEYGKVFGTYVGTMPFLTIINLDIIKAITVKNFSHFTERYVSGGSFIDGIHNGYPPGLFYLEGEQWLKIRCIVSPTFTSKKLKLMAPLIEYNCNALFNKIMNISQNGVSADIWRIFGQFTMQATLATGFGCQVDILNGEANELTTAAAGVFNSVGISPVFQLFFEQIPFSNKILKFWGKHSTLGKHFVTLLSTGCKIVQARRKQLTNTPKHPDLLQLLLECNPDEGQNNPSFSKSKNILSDEQIISTSFNFLLAGYETTSNCLGFTAYLLATNPDKQDKLCQCIEDYYLENEDASLYEAAHTIKYLEWVIQESLRLYPPVPVTARYCKETCTIDDLTIPKGCHVVILIHAIHMSPEYWDQPELFKPERFSPDEKEHRHSLSYMPFGWGPRNCVGARFALMEAKMALLIILRKYKFKIAPQTQIPMKTKMYLSLMPVNGIFLKVIPK